MEISTNEPTNGELAAKVSKEDLESIAPTNTMDNDATEVPIETLITNPHGGTTSDTMMQTDPPVETESHVEMENVTNFVDVNASDSTKTVASAPENLQGPSQTDNTLPSRPVAPVVQLPENKPLPEQLPVKSINVKNNVNIETKSCIVRLEILTEADIVKHVHVHRNNQPADPMRVKGAPVETVGKKYRTRSSVQTKPPQSTRFSRVVSMDVNYTKQDELSETDHSPTPKKKRIVRPKRVLSASRMKSDSFSTKLLSMRPLCRSTRLLKPAVSSPNTDSTDHSALQSVPKPPTSSSYSAGSSQGTFTTQSFRIKKNKRPHKFGYTLCDCTCSSIKELTKHH